MKRTFTFVLLFTIPLTILYAQQFRLKRPVPDNVQNNGTYLYGEPNISNALLAHTGLDISVRYDTIRSVSAGQVTFVGYNPADTVGGYEPGGAGNYILVKSAWNGKTVYYYYMHLKFPIASIYDSVKEGKPIAISGTTGNSTGPHLHFEIRMNYPGYSYSRTRRNPELWFGMTGTGAIYGKVPNAANSTRVDIFPDPKPRPPYTTFSYALTYNFNDPYIGSDDIYGENYAIGDVKPGTYTITALSGTYRRTVIVAAGKVVNADAAVEVAEEKDGDQNLISIANYPNPFSGHTVIRYSIPDREMYDEKVSLMVYDIFGRGVKILSDQLRTSGMNEVTFDAVGLASGVYFAVLSCGSQRVVNRMLIIK